MVKDREAIYRKFGGRCAYCGKELSVATMQVDRLVSRQRAEFLYGTLGAYEHALGVGVDDFSNLMPACRSCKHLKGTNSLEKFRSDIEDIPETLRNKEYLYRVGIDYGFYDTRTRKVSFYFETYDADYGRTGFPGK